MEFNDIMRNLRTERDWSQAEMAAKLGVSEMLVSHWETGKRKPSFEKIEALADLFHVDLNYLLGHTDAVIRVAGDDKDPSDGIKVVVTQEELDLIYAWRHANDQSKDMAAFALGLKR